MASQILALVGGISKGSLNKKLYETMKELAPTDVTLETFDISALPYFSQDLETDPPPVVRELKQKIESATAILIVTPEYNRGVPGVLKNAIDWGSRPPKKNSWEKKIVGILGASGGATGTLSAQEQLRATMATLGTRLMSKPDMYLNGSKAFDESGKISDPAVKEILRKYWGGFQEWIGSFRSTF